MRSISPTPSRRGNSVSVKGCVHVLFAGAHEFCKTHADSTALREIRFCDVDVFTTDVFVATFDRALNNVGVLDGD